MAIMVTANQAFHSKSFPLPVPLPRRADTPPMRNELVACGLMTCIPQSNLLIDCRTVFSCIVYAYHRLSDFLGHIPFTLGYCKLMITNNPRKTSLHNDSWRFISSTKVGKLEDDKNHGKLNLHNAVCPHVYQIPCIILLGCPRKINTILISKNQKFFYKMSGKRQF